MVKSLNLKETIKFSVLLIWFLSLLWLFISVFFIDVRWWWFIFAPSVISVILMALYKQEIWFSSNRNIFRSLAGWLTFSTSVFVFICAIFITPWWWFGLFIVIILFLLWCSLIDEKEKEQANRNWLIPLIVSSAFIVTFSLFCVPSFAANHGSEPNNSYDNTPPKVYVLYGGDISDLTNNKEHIFAQSWFDFKNQVNDLHNVIWSNFAINSQRSDKEFGYDNDQFEPSDEYKGDVARAMLYMYITYKGEEGFCDSKVNINLMKDWAKIDPVSTEEKQLNDWIKNESIQKNSNKFIDTPWLVGFVV